MASPHRLEPAAAPSLGDVDNCIEAAKAYERVLMQKQLKLRKFIMDMVVYRDALEGFGDAVWKGARR